LKILTVVGARPQFIKLAPLARELQRNSLIEHIIVHTGQHTDEYMSEVFFREINIPAPRYNLDIHSLGREDMIAKMHEGLTEIINKEKPNRVVVLGDTNSTLAGAQAAAQCGIPISHIEAGMRSFDMTMPEEINRIETDKLSSQLFCATAIAVQNLKNEGLDKHRELMQCGDIMYDAVLYHMHNITESSILKDLDLEGKEYILLTIHRAANTDDISKLKQIVEAINTLSVDNVVVFPIHPRTKKAIAKYDLRLNCITIDAVGYRDMMELMQNCSIVVTDSGGVQKEAYYFKKYCIILREQTEWVELIENRFGILVGADIKTIVDKTNSFKGKEFPASINNLYGKGNAAKIICKYLLS
jgi:UDP-GlcNAc3NAcA epimerase